MAQQVVEELSNRKKQYAVELDRMKYLLSVGLVTVEEFCFQMKRLKSEYVDVSTES